jgi:hypothetical protein
VKSTHRVVVALGAAALFSFAVQAQAADTLAPQAPEIAGAVSRTCNSIDLTWRGGFEPEADEAQSGLVRFEIRATTNQFRVYNGPGNSGSTPWTYLADDVGYPARHARITGLKPGAAYEFAITAFDRAGNRSPARNFPIVTVLNGAPQCSDATPPPVPDIQQLHLYTTTSCHDVRGVIEGSDAAGDLEGHFVFVDNMRAHFAAAPSHWVHLHSLTPGRQYQVSLQAVDKAGNQSAISAPTTLTVPACTATFSGELAVWAQAFYFKGEPVPATDKLATIPRILHDAGGTNVDNPLNVDRYLRESSYDKLGLKSPSVHARWTQLPRTAAEYGCRPQPNGEFFYCDALKVLGDARVAHPAHASIEAAFPLRVYFVDRMVAWAYAQSGRPHVITGLFPDLEAVSTGMAWYLRDSLMQTYSNNNLVLNCPGPGTGLASGVGNAPTYSQDLGFGCFIGGNDFSVTPSDWKRQMPHPPAVWKQRYGWIPDSQVRRITPPYSGLVGAVDRKSSLVKLATVAVAPAGSAANAITPSYSLEYVSGNGLNAGQPTGLAIRFFGNMLPQWDGGRLNLVDVLAPGESFVDPHRGIKIELLRTLAGIAAQIRVCNTAPGVAADGSFSEVCVN